MKDLHLHGGHNSDQRDPQSVRYPGEIVSVMSESAELSPAWPTLETQPAIPGVWLPDENEVKNQQSWDDTQANYFIQLLENESCSSEMKP